MNTHLSQTGRAQATSLLALGALLVSACGRGPELAYVTPVLDPYERVASRPLGDVLQAYRAKVAADQVPAEPYIDILLRISQEVLRTTDAPLTTAQAENIRRELLQATGRVVELLQDQAHKEGRPLNVPEYFAIITKVVYGRAELGFEPMGERQSSPSSVVMLAHGIVQNASPPFSRCWIDRKGVCQDLVDVYLSIVDILNRGGVRLPVELVTQTGHVAIGVPGHPGPGPILETLERGKHYQRDYYQQVTGEPLTLVPLHAACSFEIANCMSWLVSTDQLQTGDDFIRTAEQAVPGEWKLARALMLCRAAERDETTPEKRVELRRGALRLLCDSPENQFVRDYRLAILETLGDAIFAQVIADRQTGVLNDLRKVLREFPRPLGITPPFLHVLESRIELVEHDLLPLSERSRFLGAIEERVRTRLQGIPVEHLNTVLDSPLDLLHSGAELKFILSRVLRWQGRYEESLAVLKENQWRGTWLSRFEEALCVWQSGKREALGDLLNVIAAQSKKGRSSLYDILTEARQQYRAALSASSGLEPLSFPGGLTAVIEEVARTEGLHQLISAALAR